MAIVNNDALIDVLQQCNLLPPRQLGEMAALLEAQNGDVNEIAKVLLERGWFTQFQINQLLAGRCGDLIVGPYVILERLSKSSRSEVYKARHVESECTVALKVVPSEQLATPVAVNQFLVRMSALAELEHPNIVQVLDADRAGETFYCAMEFVEGRDLEKVVEVQGRLPTAVAAECIRHVALGLQCAHEHNLVHRAIRPANLFLANALAQEQPLTKIMDWSLAMMRPTEAAAEQPTNKSIEHQILGTADYLSPEQAMNPEGVDIRGDIYSLGCTFHFLLTGQPPFQGASVMEKALQHMSAEPEPVEKINPDVPAVLASIVRRMMAKQPKERFQTPVAAALALLTFSRGKSLPGASSGLALRSLPPMELIPLPDDTPLPAALRSVVPITNEARG
jgi:eukaryotic-like serine/threonine-protein kinase